VHGLKNTKRNGDMSFPRNILSGSPYREGSSSKKSFLSFNRILSAVKEDLKIALEKDPAVESKWDVLLFSISFHGLLMYRIYNALWNSGHKFSAKVLYYISKILFHMDIHPAAKIEPGVLIDHGIGVVIGSTATVKKGSVIYHGVTLGARKITSGKRHPDIGENVLIGAGAKILGPIKVGNNSQVGSNSVVLHNVPANSKVAGVPAKSITKPAIEKDEIYF